MAFKKGFYKGWLTEKALLELRKDISLNSLYVSDYENRFNIDPHQVCDFFNGYMEYLEEIAEEDDFDFDTEGFGNFFDKYDTEDNLKNWYGCFDFDNNPFTKFVEMEGCY